MVSQRSQAGCRLHSLTMTPDLINPIALHMTPSTADDEDWRQRLDSELYQPARTAGLTTDPAVYAKNYEPFFVALDRIDAELNESRLIIDVSFGSSSA